VNAVKTYGAEMARLKASGDSAGVVVEILLVAGIFNASEELSNDVRRKTKDRTGKWNIAIMLRFRF